MSCGPQKNKGMIPVGSQSAEDIEQNYVPMSVNSPSHHHSSSLPEPMLDTNYVPMTPSTMEFSSLGKQVPPPAHMGFRSSPQTPPRKPVLGDFQPPPVDRNLKPDRKGESSVCVVVNCIVCSVCVHCFMSGLSWSLLFVLILFNVLRVDSCYN